MQRVSSQLILLCAVFVLALLPALSGEHGTEHHWSYDDPAHWGNLDPAYAACARGKTQSPIDIRAERHGGLVPLKIDYHPVPLNIIDNGHTVQVNYAPGSTLTVGEKAFTLKQFHFHHPSEEHIKGEAFELVAHLVHADAEGHLVVLAVLFKEGAANPLLDTIWRSIPAEKKKAVAVPEVTVNVKDLLPSDLNYFTFPGSLTTPPCSEGVTWFVLATPNTLSADEDSTFAKLYPMNARPIQPANGRTILEYR